MKRNEPAGTGSPFSNRTTDNVHVRPVEPGELHPMDRCALCGSATSELYATLILLTEAPGVLCVDSVACARRREISRRLV